MRRVGTYGLLCAVLLMGCKNEKQQAIMNAHNTTGGIMRTWVSEGFEGAENKAAVDAREALTPVLSVSPGQDTAEGVKVLKESADRLGKIDVSNCSETFRVAFEDYSGKMSALVEGLEKEDPDLATRMDDVMTSMQALDKEAYRARLAATKRALEGLEKVELEGSPDDYKLAWKEFQENFGLILEALEADDVERFMQLADAQTKAQEKLNEVAESHGLTIVPNP